MNGRHLSRTSTNEVSLALAKGHGWALGGAILSNKSPGSRLYFVAGNSVHTTDPAADPLISQRVPTVPFIADSW